MNFSILPSSYSTKYRLWSKGFSLLGLILFLSSTSLYSATTDCIKSISFKLLTQEYRSLPTGIDINTLTTTDLLRAKTTTEIKEVEICIDQNNEMTITTIYQHDLEASHFYHNPVSKSVVTKDGTLLYDASGTLIPTAGTDPIPSGEFSVSPENLSNWGLKPLFPEMTAEQMTTLNSSGFQAWEQDGVYYLLKEARDIIFDPAQNKLSYKHYEDDLLVSAYSNQFYDPGIGYNIPLRNIEKRYRPLSTGDLLEAKTVATYLEYLLTENGDTTLHFINPNDPLNDIQGRRKSGRALSFGSYQPEERPRPHFKIYPNPATDVLYIDLRPLAFLPDIELAILDLNGKKVARQKVVDPGESVKIDIRHLPRGIYFLQSDHPDWTIHQKFIKH